MADFDSQLPIRSSAADAHFDLDTINGNTPSTGTGTVDAGTLRVTQATDVPVNVDVDSVAGTAISTNIGTADAGTIRVTQATDVPVNVDLDKINNTTVEAGYGTASTGSQRVAAMLGVGSAAVSAGNPVPVSIVSGAGGTNVHDYDTSAAIAAAASDTHSYTPGADFILHEIYFSASGQMKVEIQWGTTGGETTKSVAFTSKSTLTGSFKLTDGQLITTAMTIKVIRTNLDNQSMDVYSSIHGVAA